MARNAFNRYKANINLLVSTYPQLFVKSKPTPLAVGIFDQIVDDKDCPMTKTMLRDCLAVWCRRHEYLTAIMAPWAHRYNLDNTVQGPVAIHERDKTKNIIEGNRQRAFRKKPLVLPTVDEVQDPEIGPSLMRRLVESIAQADSQDLIPVELESEEGSPIRYIRILKNRTGPKVYNLQPQTKELGKALLKFGKVAIHNGELSQEVDGVMFPVSVAGCSHGCREVGMGSPINSDTAPGEKYLVKETQ